MSGALPPPNDWKQFLKRLQHTPLRDLLRGKGATGRLDWKNTLTACALPGTMQAVVTQICKQRKLWPLEKVAVCHELIAHFQDGLDAGESADDLVKHFGDAQIAAKLIFRGKERQRPLWWHGFKWVSRGFLALVVVYAGLTVYYAMDRVVIKTDYLAEINAVAMATPESERAWPIYREALAKWPALREEEKWEEVGEDEEKRPANFAAILWDCYAVKPGTPAWVILDKELAAHQREMNAFREGASKKCLGAKVGISGYHPEDLAFFKQEKKWGAEPAKTLSEASQSGLLGVLLPHSELVHNRVAHLLIVEMQHAIAKKDMSTTMEDFHALLGIGRQLRIEPFLISQLQGLAVHGKSLKSLGKNLGQHPELFDANASEKLAAMLDQAKVFPLHFDGERALALSIIQSFYTDDGHSDGHFTVGGVKMITSLDGIRNKSAGIAASLIQPVFSLLAASRKENADLVNRYFDQLEIEAKLAPWENAKPHSAEIIREFIASPSAWNFFHYPLIRVLLPALGSANARCAHAAHAALELGIALHRHKLAHGSFPVQLTNLVPTYLPQLPVDPITGGPLHYRLDEKGQPIVYSVGGDRQDDGGYAPVNRAGEDDTHATQRWENCEVKGDWILWPMSDRPLMK